MAKRQSHAFEDDDDDATAAADDHSDSSRASRRRSNEETELETQLDDVDDEEEHEEEEANDGQEEDVAKAEKVNDDDVEQEENEEEVDEEEDEEAPSTPVTNKKKRSAPQGSSRTASPRDDDDEEEEEQEEDLEEEDEDDDDASASPPPAKSRKTNCKTSREKSVAATAGTPTTPNRPNSRKSVTTVGVPAEAGIIRNIYLENFMCHRKLSVDFCANVNFVNGDNGSGKSAILAAIQICLGATARRTGRGRNMKALIRDFDKTNPPVCAKVRVSLANGGSDGFKQDIYGNVVTVERTISTGSGFNGYKLLDASGKEQSRSRHELYEMLDHLNIQVENPVSVLSQEEAKTFIQGNAKDKYNFFMKATELQRISSKHASTTDEIESFSAQLDKMRANLVQKNATVVELKKKWEQHKELDKLEAKIQAFAAKVGWAKYWHLDRNYQEQLADKAKIEEKAAKRFAELQQAEELASQPISEKDQLTERIAELISEGQVASDVKRQLEDELREAETPKKHLMRQLERNKKHRVEMTKKLSVAQKRLEAKRKEIMDKANNSDEAKFTAMLQEKEASLAAAKALTDGLNETLNTSRRDYEEIEPRVSQAKDIVKNAERDLYHVNQRLQGLEQSDGDEFATLGRNVKKVFMQVAKLQDQGKFKGPVVGPVAKFIKISPGKEKYAKLAELALGPKSLDKFIVTNDADRVTLQQIRQSFGCHQDCAIIQTYNNARFNVPPPPADGIETAASVLSISNDLVFNALVDMYSIDQKALALDKKSSEDALLLTNANGQQRIRGDINDVYFLPRGDHWTIRGGSLSMISNEKDLVPRIGTDKSAAIAIAKEERQKINHELKALLLDASRLDQQHTDLTRAWNLNRKNQKTNEKLVADLSSQINDLKMELDCLDNVAVDTKIEEEEVADIENDLEQVRAEEEKLKQDITSLAPRIDDISARLAETNQRNSQIIADMSDAQGRLTNLLETQTQNQSKVDRYKEKIAQYETILATHQGKIDETNEERLCTLHKARILHHRSEMLLNESQETVLTLSQIPDDEELEAIEPVHVSKDADYYKTKYNRAKQKLEQERSKQRLNDEDAEEAHRKFIQAKEELTADLAKVGELEEYISRQTKDVSKRQSLWLDFRTHLKDVTGTLFDQTLRLNGYSGSLEFDDQEKKLDLVVQKGGNSDAKTRDVKGLSGGERSFTTMCLLIALGENLETPFRILDEFDVFLDPQNRKLVMSVLIHTARLLLHRQFIFITPQDLSGVSVDNYVRIFKLKPPERTQQVGAPVQQTLPFSAASQE